MVVFGLMAPGPAKGIRVVAVHPGTDEMLTQLEPTLLASRHPILAAALQTRHLERAVARRKVLTTSSLYRRLGFDRPGPLLVQPLLDGENVLGMMLIGTPHSQQPWTARDEQIVGVMAATIASAIASSAGDAEEAHQQLREVQEEARGLSQRVSELTDELERERQRTAELTTRLRLREQEAAKESNASAGLAVWQEEIRELAASRDALRAELADWKEKAEELAHSKAGLQEQLEQVTTSTDRTRPLDDGDLSGILVSDETGRIVLVSQSVHRLLDRPRPNLIGTRLQTLFDEPSWTQAVSRLLRKEAQAGDVAAVSVNLNQGILRAELTRLFDGDESSEALAVLLYLSQRASA